VWVAGVFLFARSRRPRKLLGSFEHYVPKEIVSDIIEPQLMVKVEKEKKPAWYIMLAEEMDRLPIGKVVFNPPNTMRLGVKERLEARISKDEDANLLKSLKGRGVPQIEELKISEFMKVRLSGEDFNIIPLNEEEQIIGEKGYTEWAWDVTPKKRGKKTLHLHITLRIRLPFGEEKKDHPVMDKEIIIKVNPIYSATSFIVMNWKWILTALIVPLIGWIWKIM
jgi:hypothetical protein